MATNTTKPTAVKAEVQTTPRVEQLELEIENLIQEREGLRSRIANGEIAYKEAQQEIANLKAILKAVVRYM